MGSCTCRCAQFHVLIRVLNKILIFYYALLPVSSSTWESVGAPVAEMLSADQRMCRISDFLLQWKSSLLSHHPTAKMPRAITLDCCYAEIHAVLKVFCDTNLNKYLSRMYRWFNQTSKNSLVQIPQGSVMVFLCLNHLVKDLSGRLPKDHSIQERHLRKWILKCFGLLQAAYSRKNLFSIWKAMVIMFTTNQFHQLANQFVNGSRK